MQLAIPLLGLLAGVASALPTADPGPIADDPAINSTELVARDYPPYQYSQVCIHHDCLDFQGVYTYHQHLYCSVWAYCYGCVRSDTYTYMCQDGVYYNEPGPVSVVSGSCPLGDVYCVPN